MAENPQVIVVGAGAAGLSAAAELSRRGMAVTILEARDRIGGRIFTQTDPSTGTPVELGAEFIHGLAPEIWVPLQAQGALIREVEGDHWCFLDGQLSQCNFFSDVEKILERMDDERPDESFMAFLNRNFPPEDDTPRLQKTKEHAIGYVSGFNAADPDKVGVHWLMDGMRAGEETEEHRAFRAGNGYEDLLAILRQQLSDKAVAVHTHTIVESITWSPGRAQVTALSPGRLTLVAPKVLITLPLAVLQAEPGEAGAVRFDPPLPAEKRVALTRLEMGKVIRITLCFHNRFWDEIHPASAPDRTLSDMSFLFSEDEWFPTWWTTMPLKLPIITGWAPFHSAEQLSGNSHSFIVKRSLQSLGSMLNVRTDELERLLVSAYVHDWQSDPYSRGAYSYGKVGADGAQRVLGTPLANTLFFAGEATDTEGNNGTVQGAIASGLRAAQEILAGHSRT